MLNPIEKTNTLWKNYKGYGSTHNSRAAFEELFRAYNSISIESVLAYGDKIPRDSKDELFSAVKALDATNPIAYFQESLYKKVPIVKKHTNIQTTAISPNCDHSFVISIDGQQVKNIIPFDYSDSGIFNYTLTDANGTEIPFGVCDWIVDTNSALLTFNNGVPKGVDADHPPIISFYQYVGPVGEKSFIDALLLGIPNVPIPNGGTVVDVTTPVRDYLDNVEKDFFKKYKFSGTDTTPGLGLQYNLLTLVTDTATQDPLMGYDDNSHAQVVSILSHKKGICDQLDPTFTIFASEGIQPGFYNIQVTEEAEREGVVKVDIDEGFFILKATPGIYSIEVVEDEQVYITLLVRDNETQEFELFYPRNDLNLTVQVPLFANLNTLPPHLKLTSIANSYTDHITPQYYGPRVADFVIAAADTTVSWRSADYVVYNNDKSNIQTAIAQSEGNHILVRNGLYFVPDQTVVDNITIEGESKKDITFYGNSDIENIIYVQNSATISQLQIVYATLYITGDVVLQDIQCGNIQVHGGHVICRNVVADTITVHDGRITTFDSCIQNLNIATSGSQLEDSTSKENNSSNTGSSTDSNNDADVSVPTNTEQNASAQLFNTSVVQQCNNAGASIELYSSYVHAFNNETGVFYIQASRLHKLNVFDADPQSIVDTTAIAEVVRLPDFIKIDSSYVTKFSSAIDRSVYPDTNTLPMYTSFEKRVYARLPKPFTYHEDTNEFVLALDSIEHTLFINDRGELQCRFFTTKEIKIDSINNIETQIEYKGYGHADTKLDTIRPTTIDEALLDLYWSKADLQGGKLPIDQLPDSVAYGGLSFVGMWQFEDHGGAYPTFEDIDESFGSDDEYTSLQNGWFFIVAASHKEDDPVYPQKAIDGEEYTAGDWVIYSNGVFKKLDRAYSDPVYSRLPEYAPVKGGRENVKWSIDDGGTGLLRLDFESLAEAIRLINEVLLQLSPDRPAAISTISLAIDEEQTTAHKQEYIEAENVELSALLQRKVQTAWETDIKVDPEKGPTYVVCKQVGIHDNFPLEHNFYIGIIDEDYPINRVVQVLDDGEDITNLAQVKTLDPYSQYRMGFKAPTGLLAADVVVKVSMQDNYPGVPNRYNEPHTVTINIPEMQPHTQFAAEYEDITGPSNPLSFLQRRFYRLEDCNIDVCDPMSVNTSELNSSLSRYRIGGVGALPAGQQISGTFTIHNFARYGTIGTDANVTLMPKFIAKDNKGNYLLDKDDNLIEKLLEYKILSQHLDNEDVLSDTYSLTVTFNTWIDISQEWAEFGDLVIEAQVVNFGNTKTGEVLSLPNLHIVNPNMFEGLAESGTDLYPTLSSANANGDRGEAGTGLFGSIFNTSKPSPAEYAELQIVDDSGLQGFGWPRMGQALNLFRDNTYINPKLTTTAGGKGDGWKYITFTKKLPNVQDLSGFSIVLDWSGEEPSINPYNGMLEDVSIQICATSQEEPHTTLMNANKPVPVVFEATFANQEACCYPGYSTVRNRYITFGRKPIPVEEIFVRIGLPEGSPYVLKQCQIVAEHQPQH